MPSGEQLQSLIENANLPVNRLVRESIEEDHRILECVILHGARGVGKSTLAKNYYEAKLGGVYRDMETSEAKEEVGTGDSFFNHHKDTIIILDEMYECDYLFPCVRAFIDERRMARDRSCKFLILCSADLNSQRKLISRLAGRIASRRMTGVLLPELIASLSDKIPANSGDDLLQTYSSLTDLLMFRGGMPKSLFAKSDGDSLRERSEWIDEVVQNDCDRYRLEADKKILAGSLNVIAMECGRPFKISIFAKKLKTGQQKAQKSIMALGQMQIVRLIYPWSEFDQTDRVSTGIKAYIRDSGLLASVLGIADVHAMRASKHLSTVWKSFVIESLIGTVDSIGRLGDFGNCYYYRTHNGDSELDLIFEFKFGQKWGVVIGYAEPEQVSAGNISAAITVGVDRRLAIHNGTATYDINGGFQAIPLHKALDLAQESTR